MRPAAPAVAPVPIGDDVVAAMIDRLVHHSVQHPRACCENILLGYAAGASETL
jgi:hypothetical protein